MVKFCESVMVGDWERVSLDCVWYLILNFFFVVRCFMWIMFFLNVLMGGLLYFIGIFFCLIKVDVIFKEFRFLVENKEDILVSIINVLFW